MQGTVNTNTYNKLIEI